MNQWFNVQIVNSSVPGAMEQSSIGETTAHDE
jgi:hypothetical protein